MTLMKPLLAAGLLCLALHAGAAELVLPQGRRAFYSHEAIELAFSGLPAGETLPVTLTAEGAEALTFTVTGNGQTQVRVLPPNTLAPGDYVVQLGDQEVPKRGQGFVVSRGVWPSTMLVGQAGGRMPEGRTFYLMNAFNFGVSDPDGQPTAEPRGKTRLSSYEERVANDLPSIVYMYWTGFVLHKPWGVHKEWASPDVIENMRLFNFHVAQRLRRFDHQIHSVGSLDEPGLPWGRTAAGGEASGFTGWNVASWLEERGGTWTDDPGSLSDDAFMTYMRLRARMLGEAFLGAAADIKTVWPDALYATDVYAPHALGDGTDPMNQLANDIPTTHVFSGWGHGHIGLMGGLYVEKASMPLGKVAHAMNGQLIGARLPQPQTRYGYHLMINALLAGGLDSNWWLNYGGMSSEDLIAVNEPPARIGPVFAAMNLGDHDVAVLWSNTEAWMRYKPVIQQEAHKQDGEQVALMIADMPEDALNEEGKLKVNAYSVGQNYKGEIIASYTAITRAGYPAQVIHEDLLPQGVLDTYKVLVLIHQTFDLPAEKRAAIDAFIAAGGQVLMDATCTIDIPGAIRVDAPSIVNQGYQWGTRFGLLRKDFPPEKTREYSYYQSNHFMEHFGRDAAPAFGAALAQTRARQVMKTDSVELVCARHVGGDGELIMVINGYEKLPDIPDTELTPVWNYAPYSATYSLPSLAAGSVVYEISGLDWQTVRKVDDPTAPIAAEFQPGEMKLYLVTPRAPQALELQAKLADGVLTLDGGLQGLAAPWPLAVSVTGPAGEPIVQLYRSMSSEGRYHETIPLGRNAPAGAYTVTVTSPLANLHATLAVQQTPALPAPQVVDDTVRVFDAAPMRAFLASDPSITIAVGNADYQATADKLAAALQASGLTVTVKPEDAVFHRALYPRVWDPYMTVHRLADEMKPIPSVRKLDEEGKPIRTEGGNKREFEMVPGEVTRELNITTVTYDTPVITTPDGKPYDGKWQEVGTLLTVVGDGWIATAGTEQFVEPGVKVFVGDGRAMTYLNSSAEKVKTDAAFRAKWARPWGRLVGHVGGHNLTPQLPEAYSAQDHLILMGDSGDGELTRALQASDLLWQVADAKYPGTGKALLQFVWSPFAVERNVIYIGGSDPTASHHHPPPPTTTGGG